MIGAVRLYTYGLIVLCYWVLEEGKSLLQSGSESCWGVGGMTEVGNDQLVIGRSGHTVECESPFELQIESSLSAAAWSLYSSVEDLVNISYGISLRFTVVAVETSVFLAVSTEAVELNGTRCFQLSTRRIWNTKYMYVMEMERERCIDDVHIVLTKL